MPQPPPWAATLVRFLAAWFRWGMGLAVIAFLAFIFLGLRLSGAYTAAVQAAEQSPDVIQCFGAPLDTPIIVDQGSIQGDFAEYRFPITGPKKIRGILHAQLGKDQGRWKVTLLEITVVGGAPIRVVPGRQGPKTSSQ